MGTIIIFDAADMCGKTEMAKELSRLTSIPYFKNKTEWKAFSADPAYFAKALEYGDPYFYNFLKDTNISVILDRSFPSEWVYSKVFRRETNIAALEHVDALAAAAGAKIVVPYRTSYFGMKDKEHDINAEHLSTLSSAYEEFCSWTKCKTLRLCVDSEDLAWEMLMILKFMRSEK